MIISLAGVALADSSPRERWLLDSNWKFHLGDDWGLGEKLDKAGGDDGPVGMNFNDRAWRTLTLPHDWAIELPFDSGADNGHGSKPVGPGFQTNSVGWYRREFTLPKTDQGNKLWLEFDGVYRDCRVFLNGYRLMHHESGYNGFRCDISDIANYGGTNILAVRVDASQFEGWFYEGAGIYRHVWLEKTSPLAVAPDGVFVYSQFQNNQPGGVANIRVQTQLRNAQRFLANATVTSRIISPEGTLVGEYSHPLTLDPLSEQTVESTLSLCPPGMPLANPQDGVALVHSPELWSPELPELYRLVTSVTSGGEIVDHVETEFGIRTVGFDTTNGFLLNGKPYVIKGTCNHQDHAGVGSALPDALQNFRVAKLKEMGDNAIRTSHNESTPELLAACDRLGMLVMDENRRLGSDNQNLAELEQQIRRDRNHPSVFIWSLANEEYHQRDSAGAMIFQTMQDLVHRLDPTRLCTAAMNSWSGGTPEGFSTVMDVQGFNYLNNGDMDAFHRSNPSRPCIGTEEASAYYTRGIYEKSGVYDSAYDGNKPGYGATAEEWWKFYAARPWASGSFVWTGFDYRGEPSPFHWPNINSEFGILDTCGFPKDVFYYYQSWWTDKPVLHLMPHWNWPGREGKPVDVRCFSNCEEVELFLNGQSLGRKTMSKNSHLQWTVNYAPGILSAKGYQNGKVIAEAKVETTGEPAAVQLTPDRSTIHGDGEDCSVITVAVTDAQGRTVPTAANAVHFELAGPGRIIGVGNGDPVSHEPDVYSSQPMVREVSPVNWRMQKVSSVNNRQEIAADFDASQWPEVNVRANDGPLEPGERAVFQAHLQLTAEDLTAANALLDFGMIDDEGWVYVNGRLAGESHDWSSGPSFEIRKFLRSGDNTIAVIVKNNDGSGGINKGVALELVNQPVPAKWQRKAFNGLAEVIVQADKNAGEIKLTAYAPGLAPATRLIQSEPYPARPSVP